MGDWLNLHVYMYISTSKFLFTFISGKQRRGSRPGVYKRANTAVLRNIVQNLEKMRILDKDSSGWGRNYWALNREILKLTNDVFYHANADGWSFMGCYSNQYNLTSWLFLVSEVNCVMYEIVATIQLKY